MTDSGGPVAPPGWFEDPGGSGGLRWWDGARWTEHTRAAMTTESASAGATHDELVHDERTMARWARHAIWVYALCLPVGGVLTWRMIASLRDVFRAGFFEPGVPPPTEAELLGLSEQMLAGLQLLNAVQLAAFVVLLVWIFKAATAAARLGIPARRAAGWAVGSWFIPILNFWWPYQSLRDLFPDGHPARRRILVLWLICVGASAVILPGLVMQVASGPGAALLAVGYLTFTGALLAGRPVISQALEAHERIARGEAEPNRWL